VRWQFAGKGLRLTLAGIALGLPAALAAGRAASGLIAGVSSADPAALTAAVVVAAVSGVGAAWLAARRAAALDPAEALRDS